MNTLEIGQRLEDILKENHSEIYYSCLSVLGGFPGLISDAQQSVRIKTWETLEKGGEIEFPKAWFRKVAKNEAISTLRKELRHHPQYRQTVDESTSDNGWRAAEMFGRVQAKSLLILIEEHLDQRQLRIFRDVLQGIPKKDIAESLGLKPSALSYHLNMIKALIQLLIDGPDGGGRGGSIQTKRGDANGGRSRAKGGKNGGTMNALNLTLQKGQARDFYKWLLRLPAFCEDEVEVKDAGVRNIEDILNELDAQPPVKDVTFGKAPRTFLKSEREVPKRVDAIGEGEVGRLAGIQLQSAPDEIGGGASIGQLDSGWTHLGDRSRALNIFGDQGNNSLTVIQLRRLPDRGGLAFAKYCIALLRDRGSARTWWLAEGEREGLCGWVESRARVRGNGEVGVQVTKDDVLYESYTTSTSLRRSEKKTELGGPAEGGRLGVEQAETGVDIPAFDRWGKVCSSKHDPEGDVVSSTDRAAMGIFCVWLEHAALQLTANMEQGESLNGEDEEWIN